MANNARMVDQKLFMQAGIDPKTRLPVRMAAGCEELLKRNIKALLRVQDEQDAINTGTWYNCPSGIDGHLIERILYYRGQGMFFYIEELDKFFFLPYALNGTIDIYGRFNSVSPLPFNGTSEDNKDGKDIHNPLTGIVRTCAYEVELERGEKYKTHCVLLHDYSMQISQINIPRQILQEPLLDTMSECIPFMNTAMLASTGISGMRVNDQDQQANVLMAASSMRKAALTGKPWVPVVGAFDIQELTNHDAAKSEEFLLPMQALDNFRLSMHGLSNGGLFEKKAHMLGAEQAMRENNASRVLQDRVYNRQHFCDIVNSIWNLGMYFEPNEQAVSNDQNLDGQLMNEVDQTGLMQGEQPQLQGVNNNDTMQ